MQEQEQEYTVNMVQYSGTDTHFKKVETTVTVKAASATEAYNKAREENPGWIAEPAQLA